MTLLVALDKVYVDFIVHSFITTELCFYEHYLYALQSTSRSVSCPSYNNFIREIYCSSLLNCLRQKPDFSSQLSADNSQKAFYCQSLSEAHDLYEYKNNCFKN